MSKWLSGATIIIVVLLIYLAWYLCTSRPIMFAFIFVLDLISFMELSHSILGSVLIVEGILCCRFVYTCMHELQFFQALELTLQLCHCKAESDDFCDCIILMEHAWLG